MNWVLWAILLAGIAIWWVRRAMNRPGLVEARVRIREAGESDVTLAGESTAENLMLLALVYGAKVRWLLNNEPPETLEIFQSGTRQCANLLGSHSASELSVALAPGTTARAVEGDEEYVIRFHRNTAGEGYVINSLPRPCLSANVAWHYFLLLSAIEPQLTRADNEELGIALLTAQTQWEMENGKDMAALKMMTRKSNHSYRPSNARA
jgi:hypothetical protein